VVFFFLGWWLVFSPLRVDHAIEEERRGRGQSPACHPWGGGPGPLMGRPSPVIGCDNTPFRIFSGPVFLTHVKTSLPGKPPGSPLPPAPPGPSPPTFLEHHDLASSPFYDMRPSTAQVPRPLSRTILPWNSQSHPRRKPLHPPFPNGTSPRKGPSPQKHASSLFPNTYLLARRDPGGHCSIRTFIPSRDSGSRPRR